MKTMYVEETEYKVLDVRLNQMKVKSTTVLFNLWFPGTMVDFVLTIIILYIFVKI